MKRRTFTIFRLAVICSVFLFAAAVTANAQTPVYNAGAEKPIVLKGLSIGMDINDARKICVKLAGKDWNVSQIDARDTLMEDYRDNYRVEKRPDLGVRGFLIKNKGGYIDGYGFISGDSRGKVIQITFTGELSEYLFDAKGVNRDFFMAEMTRAFGFPEMTWINHGWEYSSPFGYDLTVMNDKAIDIRKSDKYKTIKRIKFD